VEQTGSTNADLIADTGAAEGEWLVARKQHSGRGRQGRAWDTLAGNFHGSTLVSLRDGDPPAQSLSLAASLALAEAIDSLVPGQPLMLKWPNDVLLLGRKLAGILLERSGQRVVVGFGVNLAAAPDLAGRRAASLDGALSVDEFAPVLAASFARLLRLWRTSEPALLAQAWLARAHPVGSRLTVHSGSGEAVSGRFDGLESDGALRLRRDDGALDIVRAADVEL
jgi:BirA family biotin operon repressor/biotin-[acetyl-CoA-carboxylase] ligase